MHEDIRAVVDELDALFLPGRDVLHEPAGEHGREHDVRFGIARFFAPNRELLRFQGFHVIGRAAVEIVDIGRDGVAVGVDAGDAADDPVAHNGPDFLYVPALFLHLAAARSHALLDEAVIFIDVHLDPARLGIGQMRLGRVHGQAVLVLVIDGDFDALRAGVETEIILITHG